jgi:hypothetical protein
MIIRLIIESIKLLLDIPLKILYLRGKIFICKRTVMGKRSFSKHMKLRERERERTDGLLNNTIFNCGRYNASG